MAALTKTNLTLLDLAKRTDPNGQIAQITEILNKQNEILDDMVWMPGNLATGHRATIRTGVPTPTWRMFNQGVQPTKSTTAQVTFNTGMMETFSEMDEELALLHGNAQAARLSEDLPAIEGINQELSSTLFYGNEATNPAEFTGLANYYNDPTAESGDNLINGGAAGADTDYGSIWLVGWSDNTIAGLIPKHSKAGIEMKDLGLQLITNSDGSKIQKFVTQFKQKAGLAVKDWRYGVRVANIRRGELNAGATGNSANLPDLMFTMLERLPSLLGVRPVFYMDRTMREFLRKQLASATSNSTLTFEDVGGRRTAMFQDFPVRIVDALAATETPISF